MKCPSSILITRRVDQCPRNALEWDKRATIFNCSLVNQTCVSPEMFDYHCVMNGDGTILIEVCAPIKTIHGNATFLQLKQCIIDYISTIM